MINWENINYSMTNAESDFSKLQILVDQVNPIRPTASLSQVREKLLVARDSIFEQLELDGANKLGYEFHLLFGLEVHNILSEEIGFTRRTASNDDVWRYLSVTIIPDIVHARWGLNEDHFYRKSRRIWLKTIWWYIELSWHNTKEETYMLLKKNTTDTILQLVERPGIGYHIDLDREIMYQYNDYDDKDRRLFRSVLKLNMVRLTVITPELVEGGISAYVKDLFKTVQGV